MTIFFTADLHAGHKNIIKYCNRPFKTVEEMDAALVNNWNNAVSPNDTTYVLGDFSMSKEAAPKILDRLNGKKKLIWGNHDSNQVRKLSQWTDSQPFMEINLEGHHITLCHYALKTWNKAHRGSLAFHGHSHGSLPGSDQSLDVGVDCWDYRPVTLQMIKARLKTLPAWKSVDHHGAG